VAAVVGHSFGELTALCIAGVYSISDAIKLISGRARLICDSWGSDSGSMMAVEGNLENVRELLAMSRSVSSGESDASIACYNGPRSFTLGGSAKVIQSVEDLVKKKSQFSCIRMKRLNVTNAFHSALVDPLMNDLETPGQKIVLNKPIIQIERETESKSTCKLESGLVAQHLRNPVFFNHAVHRISKEFPTAIWLEAGSNSTVTTMARRALRNSNSDHHFQSVNITSEGCFQPFVDTTTKLWSEGLNVAFWGHHAKQVSDHTSVILPSYQFEKSRHWMDLKEMPKLEAPIGESTQPEKIQTGLTTFIGYQDETGQEARFRVNTMTENFLVPTQTNVIASTTAVTPGMLHLEIALDAITNLRAEFNDSDM
jgi:acyl transferase domain-containing protein